MKRVVGLVLLSVLLSPIQRELYVGDETKYSQVVREMRGGAVLLPTLEGSPFTHKPPLHFWIVDALTYVFGLYSIWPFVLPSIIAFALLLALMWRMGGPMAAFVCGTSVLMWGSAQTARMDVGFAALLALAAFFVERDRLLPASIATGFAFLVKGPMAPVIIIALYAFEAIRLRRKPRGRDALALLPMLLIPLLWLVPALIAGGEPFWREIFYKQTVGRAVGAWVHKSPPWFYVMRAPATLLPWFFLLVVAIVAAYKRNDARMKFGVSWILAVLVPYSLLSSKLDVYMIAMLPAVALTIARFIDVSDRFDAWGKRANLVMLALFALIGIAGFFVKADPLLARMEVRAMLAILLIAALAAMVVTLRATLVASTVATGFVFVVAGVYAAIALVPLANELVSPRPLVRALEMQNAAPEDIGLYACPHVWIRGMDPEFGRVPHYDADALRAARPRVIVARRKNENEIADVLRGYTKTGELQMLGKPFDVFGR